MVEEGIRGGMCQVSHRYSKANNKYMNDFDKNTESTYIQYFGANNLYGWAMWQLLPVSGFKQVKNKSKFTTDFILNYDVYSDVGCIFQATIRYPEKIHGEQKDLPFLPQKEKINKCQKLICSIEDKEKYVVHIKVLKQALKYGLVLEEVHSVIKFNQKAWLKPYIDLNTELRKNANNESDKDFFKLMNNSVFGKTMENVRNYRDIKLVRTNSRRNQLVSEPNYHSTKYFSEDLIAIEMNKTNIKMNKPIYLGQSILDISKTLMYEFWYEYLKPKYGDKIKLCYTHTDSFVIEVKTEDLYAYISDDVKK